jgi:aminopeptidase-like protein
MKNSNIQNNFKMMNWAKDLFPLCRSLTGSGNDQTFKYIIDNANKKFKIKYTKSDTKVFDWKIPWQWEIRDAYIKLPNGKKICEFKKNNLHIVGYSVPKNGKYTFSQIKKKIFYLKKQPDAVPYVTSYYKKDWGFCMSYNQFKKLPKNGVYNVFINSRIFRGKMGSMELLIPGRTRKEILITSYTCHPSMANNELSGPLIIMALSKILKKSYYSVRLLLIPETIGAINYIKKNLNNLKKNLIAGFNLTCVGDNGPISWIKSKDEITYADKIAERVFKKIYHRSISFLYRGSNERQFGCQNLKLPFITITRNVFGNYKHYHTSLDNLTYISEKNLKYSLKMVLKIINEIQNNRIFIKKNNCELFLTKYKLINTLSFVYKKQKNFTNHISNIMAFCDKNLDTTELKKTCNLSSKKLGDILAILIKKKLIKKL